MTILKTSSNTTSGSASISPFQAAFLRSRQSSTAGSTLRGIVKVDVEAARKEGIEIIKAKLRVEQRSTYYQDYGGAWHDYRSQKRKLYTDEITIWTSEVVGPPDAPPQETTTVGDLKLYPDEKDVPPGSTSTSTSTSPPVVATSFSTTLAGIPSFPFAFVLPSSEEQLRNGNVLPPSFRSGPRTNSKLLQTINFVRGTEVGYVRYFVKVTASGGRARTSRKILPFVYLPPRVTDPSAIPPSLVPADEISLPPSAPARPSESDGWKTHVISKDWREGMAMFGKKNKAVVKLSLPSLPAFSSSTPIPYRVSLLLLSPPTTSSSQSTVNLPSPSALSFHLVQELWTRARGSSQTIIQTISRVGDNVGGRVWYGEAKFWDEDEAGVVFEFENGVRERKRWGVEIVMVGEMSFGVVPPFEKGIGGLAVNYRLDIRLPLKGLLADLHTTILPTVKISSTLAEGAEEEFNDNVDSLSARALPPSYFDVVEGTESDGEDEARVWKDEKT